MNDLLKNNRICPKPQHWNKLREILKSKTDKQISAPLILAAWWHTSDDEKFKRFQYHLSIAKEYDIIAEVKTHLESLNESDWHHKGK